MDAVPQLIAKKKDGHRLTKGEIYHLIAGCTDGSIPAYQISALLMAIYFQGMDAHETAHLTMAMAQSGTMLDLSPIEGVIVDKHSTGGIADTTTLVLLPLAAAAGVKVAKISGRGLGYTGGTIDKLAAIPGFNTNLSDTQFITTVNKIGAAIAGQTRTLVPADKILYALRDVTATVDSIPLIASSIMSKKIAGGAAKIILDVKCGRGAFMKDYRHALELGRLMVRIGELAGRETAAYVTAMDQPLGLSLGNSIEIIEASETLKGRGHRDLRDLSLTLGAAMLALAGIESDSTAAKTKLAREIATGRALAKFREIIAAQGGNPSVADDYSLLPQATIKYPLLAETTGYIHNIDALRLGKAALLLGAGRETVAAVIDPAVGIRLAGKVGDYIEAGEPLAHIFANDAERLRTAHKEITGAIEIVPHKVAVPALIYAYIPPGDRGN